LRYSQKLHRYVGHGVPVMCPTTVQRRAITMRHVRTA
jgi:hypothetical protein